MALTQAKRVQIAIDGPAGAGKSSVAKIVAKRLSEADISKVSLGSFEYIDSGAIYRAVTKTFLDNGIDYNDSEKVRSFLQTITISLINNRVLINNIDLTDCIRTREVSQNVSPVSSNIDVRKKVNSFLNDYSKECNVIMDGRDITTVVFPNAKYKFYLDASIEERANRRFRETNSDMTLEEIKQNIAKRDENDKNKPYGALKIADDAVYIDTTSLSMDEVVKQILTTIYNGEEHGV